MDFLNETVKKIPPGDSESYLGELSRKKKKNAETSGDYKPSDIPGFVHPVVDGMVDKTAYVPQDLLQTGEPPPVLTREEALSQQKKKKPPEEVLFGGASK